MRRTKLKLNLTLPFFSIKYERNDALGQTSCELEPEAAAAKCCNFTFRLMGWYVVAQKWSVAVHQDWTRSHSP